MKNKLVTIILGCILIASIGLNIYLFSSLSSLKTQAEASSDQLQTLNNQINSLQDQLSSQSELQSQLSDLEQQLANSKEEQKELEDTLSANQQHIKELEDTLSVNQEYIESLTSNNNITGLEGSGGGTSTTIPSDFPYVDRTPADQQQPIQQPGELPAGLSGFSFGDIPQGTGDGSGAIGHFGHYE